MVIKNRFRRGGLICRAKGASSIYERSHKERIKVLQENHDKHFTGMAVGFLAPKQEPDKHTVKIFGKEMKLSKEEYARYQNAFKQK